MLVAFVMINPLGLAFFYLPVWYLGNVTAQAENYLEHYGARPGNRKTDSVSSYGALYNLIWFNNGYHQEHHYRPQVHWTRIPGVKALLPPESERRVVRGAHWFNFSPRPEVPPRDRRHGLGPQVVMSPRSSAPGAPTRSRGLRINHPGQCEAGIQ